MAGDDGGEREGGEGEGAKFDEQDDAPERHDPREVDVSIDHLIDAHHAPDEPRDGDNE